MNLLYLIMYLTPPPAQLLAHSTVCWFNSTHKAKALTRDDSDGVRRKRRIKNVQQQRRCLTPPSTKLCKQFTSYNFPPPAQCSWKAAVKWNNVNNNIPQQTIFFSLLFSVLLMFGRFGFSSRENVRASSSHSCVLLFHSHTFFLDSWIHLIPLRPARRPHFALGSFFIAFFLLLSLCHAMTWSGENYIATYFPQFPTFIRQSGRGVWGTMRRGRAVVSEWTREPSEHKTSEWKYKSVRWRMKNTFLRPLQHTILFIQSNRAKQQHIKCTRSRRSEMGKNIPRSFWIERDSCYYLVFWFFVELQKATRDDDDGQGSCTGVFRVGLDEIIKI